MSKFSIFSVLLVGTLLVAPIVTANNYPTNKIAKASDIESSSSIIINSISSVANSNSFGSLISSSLVDTSSLQSLGQQVSSSSAIKKTKLITDVKPVKLNVQAANWWTDTDSSTGGNSDTLGLEAINVQIQSKLQVQCPNIYDTVAKTINETNLANCTPINNLPLQKIAIIDSGVTPNAEMTPFVDQVNSWNFFTSTNYPAKCTATSPLNFYTLVQGNTTTYYCKEKGTQSDTDYHGTVVALTAIRTFENSLLKNRIKIVPFSLRTLDTINISEAIDEVVRAGDIKTVNLSVGTPYNLNYVEDSVNLANTNNISVYASSGNCAIYSPSNCDYNGNTVQDLPEEANNAPDYPASYVNAIMVGSNNYSENSIPGIIRATYSNFAQTLRSNFVVAPVGNSGIILPCFTNCGGTANYSYLGTSFASPQAAGLDGLVAQYSGLMKQNLAQANEKVLVSTDTPKQYITTNTTDILAVGNDLESGSGLINLKKISDKIVTQLQTFNIPASSSSILNSSSIIPSSSLLSSISSVQSIPASSTVSSAAAKNTMINTITLNSNNSAYIVTSTSNFIPAFGGDHVHFYYNTEANTVMNKMFSSSGPYTILVSTKPANATQLCTIVGTASHGIYPNTGNCVDLPSAQQVTSSSLLSSSSILASSSNVISSSSNQAPPAFSSSVQANAASSSQISSPNQANSSSAIRSSSQIISSSSQNSSSISSAPFFIVPIDRPNSNGGGVISIISGIISNIIKNITGASATTSGNTIPTLTSSSITTLTNNGQIDSIVKENTTKEVDNVQKQTSRLAEDSVFEGLVNNPIGSVLQSEIVNNQKLDDSIKSISSLKNIDLQISPTANSKTELTISKSSQNSSQSQNCDAMRKGWDGSVKGNIIPDCEAPIVTDIQSNPISTVNYSEWILPLISILAVGSLSLIAFAWHFKFVDNLK